MSFFSTAKEAADAQCDKSPVMTITLVRTAAGHDGAEGREISRAGERFRRFHTFELKGRASPGE